MATALKLEEPETGTDIVLAVNENPGIVLLDTEKFDAWYEKLSAKAPTATDMTVRKDREALRTFAAEVRSEKAAIDKARLRLTKEWRDMTAQANEAGKVIESRLEQLAIEKRKPLTDWEEAEKARAANCQRLISEIRAAGTISIDDTADMVRDRGSEVFLTLIDPEQFGELFDEAQAAKDHSVETLKAALARLTREEADRAELERLRAENEARVAKETAEREARELAEKVAEEERQEAKRVEEAAAAEKERIANAAREAEDRVRREADEATQAAEAKRSYARQIIEHIKQVGLGMIDGKPYPYGILLHELEAKITIDDSLGDMQDEVRTIRDITLANVKAAMERQAEKTAADAQVEKDRIEAAERAKLAANVAHRTKIKTEAKQALITCGADDETARKIVMAILAGEVPHVRMEF